MPGKLEKLRIVAYSDAKLEQEAAGGTFVVAFVFGVLQWRDLAASGSSGELFFTARDFPGLRTPMVVMDPYSAFAGMVLFAVGLVGLFAAWKLISTLDTSS